MNKRLIYSLELLRDHLFNGWVGFALAQEMINISEHPEFTLFRNVVNIIHFTNAEYSLLELSKLVSKNDESVQIYYLLNLIEEEARLKKDDALINLVSEHRMKIEEFSEIINQIITHRDKRIAHLDRLLLNPISYKEKVPPINMENVEVIYSELEKIINVYCFIYKIDALNIISYESAIHKEWGFILDRLVKKEENGFDK